MNKEVSSYECLDESCNGMYLKRDEYKKSVRCFSLTKADRDIKHL